MSAITSYLKRKALRSEVHLAALIAVLGVERIARDSGIPPQQLRQLLETRRPVGGFAAVTPNVFRLGCALGKTVQSQSSRRRSKRILRACDLILSRYSALPDDIEVKLPAVTAETDQGEIGSCVAWAAAHAAESAMDGTNRTEMRLNPSSIFAIIKDQELDPWPTSAEGSTLDAGANALADYGALLWSEFPIYRTAPDGNPGNLPVPDGFYESARDQRMLVYSFASDRWDDTTRRDAGQVLAGETHARRPLPIFTGFPVFASLFNAQTQQDGFVPLPLDDEESLGGHAVAMMGRMVFDDHVFWKIKNSWGLFGDQGYLYFPDEYVAEFFHSGYVTPGFAASTAIPSWDHREHAWSYAGAGAGIGLVAGLIAAGVFDRL